MARVNAGAVFNLYTTIIQQGKSVRGKYMNKVKLMIAGVVLAIVSLGGVSAAHAASNVDVDLPNEAVTGGTSVVVPSLLAVSLMPN